MTPEAGLLLGGRYELLDRIAVGGMGEVWRARDHGSGQTVAAKVLRAELAGDERFLGRLRAEARNSAGLRHPNLATLLDHGEQDRSGYLVMELVHGEPMSELLQRQKVLRPATLLPILAQTAHGLQAVHAAGVVHRDVKPSNILLTPDGGVKLTDFGISLGTDQAPMTAAGMVMGTAQYLPPEQAMGRAARPAGDVYALGVVAYEALAGRRPYTGATQVDIAFAHVNQPLPPLPTEVPAAVSAVVEQMLAKDPEQRPASAAAVALAFEDVLAGLRRRRWVASVGAVTSAGTVASPASPRAASAASATSAAGPTGTAIPTMPPTPPPAPAVGPGSPAGAAAPAEPAHAGAPLAAVRPATRRELRGRPHRREHRPSPVEVVVGGPAPAGGTPAPWRLPRWHELAADRLWLTMVAGATLVAVLLGAMTLGTLTIADNAALGHSPGALPAPMTKDG